MTPESPRFTWGDPPSPKESKKRDCHNRILSKVDIARINKKINGSKKLTISKEAVQMVQDITEATMNQIIENMEEAMNDYYYHPINPEFITWCASTAVKKTFPGRMSHVAHMVGKDTWTTAKKCEYVYDKMMDATWEDPLPEDYEKNELMKL
jgi:proline dehydrogenase